MWSASAVKWMHNPDPILQLKGSISVLHSYFKPELTFIFIFSNHKLAQERKSTNMASISHFGLIVQMKVLKSIQKDFSGNI